MVKIKVVVTFRVMYMYMPENYHNKNKVASYHYMGYLTVQA